MRKQKKQSNPLMKTMKRRKMRKTQMGLTLKEKDANTLIIIRGVVKMVASIAARAIGLKMK